MVRQNRLGGTSWREVRGRSIGTISRALASGPAIGNCIADGGRNSSGGRKAMRERTLLAFRSVEAQKPTRIATFLATVSYW